MWCALLVWCAVHTCRVETVSVERTGVFSCARRETTSITIQLLVLTCTCSTTYMYMYMYKCTCDTFSAVGP